MNPDKDLQVIFSGIICHLGKYCNAGGDKKQVCYPADNEKEEFFFFFRNIATGVK